MEVKFPEIPEYRFMLNALCGNIFPSFPRFRCDPLDSMSGLEDADVAFVPAPVALARSDSYVILSAGAIFSYLTGPVIVSPVEGYKELQVRRDDFFSRSYARIFLSGIAIKEGDGYPAILEPRLAILSSPFPYPKVDLYSSWASITENLPLPLYCGIIRRDIRETRGIVEEAVRASVKYALNNADLLVKEIAHLHGIRSTDLLKRVVLNFINKNTLSMAVDEREAIEALRGVMEKKGIGVHDLMSP
ncbi:MAG: MqnA/MqnD/SBP family protein [Thermoplasmata archaeon]